MGVAFRPGEEACKFLAVGSCHLVEVVTILQEEGVTFPHLAEKAVEAYFPWAGEASCQLLTARG